jgi:hypothetical protein
MVLKDAISLNIIQLLGSEVSCVFSERHQYAYCREHRARMSEAKMPKPTYKVGYEETQYDREGDRHQHVAREIETGYHGDGGGDSVHAWQRGFGTIA